MMLTPAPIRVLLVEPHADSRELYVLGLTAAGFNVIAAVDAASATVAFAAHAPTIVVTETRLFDGSDLLTWFSDAAVPVIALTTDPLFSTRGAIATSVSAVLLKPCSPADVVAAIRAALGVAPQ